MFDWHRKLKEGRRSLQDAERRGRFSAFRTQESMEVIQTLSVRPLEEMTGINRGTVRKILIEDLGKKKVLALVRHLLTPDQEHQRPASSVEFVEIADNDRNTRCGKLANFFIWQLPYETGSELSAPCILKGL
jgi:hypothetical protein